MRIGASVALVFVAGIALLSGVETSTISYSLPARPGTDVLPTRTALWAPGVAAAVWAGLVLLASLGWLYWNVRGRPTARWWLAAVGLVLCALLLDFAVYQLPSPTF